MADGTSSYAASSCSTTSGEGQGTDPHPTEKNPSGAKRRASRAGTRSVSTLTPAQLQRKRANDREAQRAIRQRNKEHIESLERRIEELSIGNVDAATLVQLRNRVRELEEELTKANENLAASRTAQISRHPVWQARSNGELVHSQVTYSTSHAMNMPTRSGSYAEIPSYNGHSTSFGDNHALIVPEPEDSKDFILNDDSDLQRSWVHPHLGLEHTTTMNFTTQTPYSHQVPAYYSAPYTQTMNSSSFMGQPSMHAYEIPIRYAPPTGMVDNLLISILQTQRRQILEGALTAPASSPHLGSLIKSTNSPTPATEPISLCLTRILTDFTTRMGLAETAGCFYIMHKLLQWEMVSSLENYNAMPEWYTPRPSQLTESHPIWVSHIAWPGLRERIISNQAAYATPEFMGLFTSSVNVNWPYRETDILMYVNGEVRVTPLFAKHIYKLENWSLSAPFQQRYPELTDCCKFGNSPYTLAPPDGQQNAQDAQ